MDREFWHDKYPASVPFSIDTRKYQSVLELFDESIKRYAAKPAYTNMGHTLSYAELDRLSAAFAAWLQQHTDLQPGDRIAVQLPNLLQYPVVVFGAMRAGLIVVNTNPLYTEREMVHQFNDAGAKALVSFANVGDLVAKVLPQTAVRHVIITELGDLLPVPRRLLVNAVVKHVKKMVPTYTIPGVHALRDVLRRGRRLSLRAHAAASDDVAILQYTGGTTGVAKGAMLTHANLVANLLQMRVQLSHFQPGEEMMVAPLPLYHIFAFTVCCLGMMEMGGHALLITNPRDLPAFVKEMKRYRFTAFAGLNTLFVALLNNAQFRQLDFSSLKMTVAGGMALTHKAAQEWESVTGCRICEGFGMTETSPVISMNPLDAIQLGSIGLPVSNTEIKIVDDQGEEVAIDATGEICVRGPQVMKGYWQRPEATAETIDADGWLHTGDIGLIQPDGYLRIVDRKKDMILVSGFNVYPNEIEDVVATLGGVLESAAVGVQDAKSGEAVKLFVVRKDPKLTEADVLAHCRANLTGYKVPRSIVFRDALPKSPVGKILRRELRDQ